MHVDRRVVGWSTGRHVDHPCGGQISPWLARKVADMRGGVCRNNFQLEPLIAKPQSFRAFESGCRKRGCNKRGCLGNVPSAATTPESLVWWIIRCYI